MKVEKRIQFEPDEMKSMVKAIGLLEHYGVRIPNDIRDMFSMKPWQHAQNTDLASTFEGLARHGLRAEHVESIQDLVLALCYQVIERRQWAHSSIAEEAATILRESKLLLERT